jgi:hypothetical protein
LRGRDSENAPVAIRADEAVNNVDGLNKAEILKLSKSEMFWE